MDVNVIVTVSMLSMSIVGIAIAKLGSSFFDAVSRNPVIGDKMTTMVIMLAAMIELFGLIMVLIALSLVFIK